MSSMRSEPGGALDGCRVLVIEDEYFLAEDLAAELSARGAKIVGPISDLRKAQDQVSDDNFDVAVIDVNLKGELAWPIADRLKTENIPFVFVTGYSASILPHRFRSIRTWQKPCDITNLSEAIRLLCPLSKAKH